MGRLGPSLHSQPGTVALCPSGYLMLQLTVVPSDHRLELPQSVTGRDTCLATVRGELARVGAEFRRPAAGRAGVGGRRGGGLRLCSRRRSGLTLVGARRLLLVSVDHLLPKFYIGFALDWFTLTATWLRFWFCVGAAVAELVEAAVDEVEVLRMFCALPPRTLQVAPRFLTIRLPANSLLSTAPPCSCPCSCRLISSTTRSACAAWCLREFMRRARASAFEGFSGTAVAPVAKRHRRGIKAAVFIVDLSVVRGRCVDLSRKKKCRVSVVVERAWKGVELYGSAQDFFSTERL